MTDPYLTHSVRTSAISKPASHTRPTNFCIPLPPTTTNDNAMTVSALRAKRDEEQGNWTLDTTLVEALRAQVAALQADNERLTGERDDAIAAIEQIQAARDEAVSKLLTQLDEATDQRAAEATRAEDAEAERDEARADLNRRTTQLRHALAEVDQQRAKRIVLRSKMMAVEDERDAMRPVVEAAKDWAEFETQRSPALEDSSIWLEAIKACRTALLAAVDQYQTTPEPVEAPSD